MMQRLTRMQKNEKHSPHAQAMRISNKKWLEPQWQLDQQHHTPNTIACRVDLQCESHSVRPKGVFVEQDSEVRVAIVRNVLIGDVRNMITGFLSGDNSGRISARQ